jgi:NAD(P)H dehydrogenase (quinone)
MNVLIILGHPDEKSFNHAIADTCRNRLIENGHSVIFHDLYKEGFNPVIDKIEIPKNGHIDTIINAHCEELINSDGIIIIHPNWWGQPPAILKGWIDRVIRPGIAYEFKEGDNGEGLPIGLLKAKTGLVFNTSNTYEERENNTFKDPLETLWKNCIFNFCGVTQFDRIMFRIIVTSNLNQRLNWLNEVEMMIDKYFSKTTTKMENYNYRKSKTER